MEILFHDYYSSYDNIDKLNNYYNDIYQYYKKKKDISMYLLKNKLDIIGILIYENINKLCKIYIIDIITKEKYIYNEFIYFIGDFLVNNFNKFIFCNINTNILKTIYNLVLKYNNFQIYNLDNKLINNFQNINETDIYIFNKCIDNNRNDCCAMLI